MKIKMRISMVTWKWKLILSWNSPRKLRFAWGILTYTLVAQKYMKSYVGANILRFVFIYCSATDIPMCEYGIFPQCTNFTCSTTYCIKCSYINYFLFFTKTSVPDIKDQANALKLLLWVFLQHLNGINWFVRLVLKFVECTTFLLT